MKIPLFPLDLVLFPGAALPLHIFEDRYRQMVRECVDGNLAFGVVRARREGMAVIGCMAHIVAVTQEYSDGRFDILCQGTERFEIEMLDDTRDFLQAEVALFHDRAPEMGMDRDKGRGRDGALDSTRLQREQCAAMHFELTHLAAEETEGAEPAVFPWLDLNASISFQLAAAIPADLGFKQELLGLRSDAQRCERLIEFYSAVLPKLRRGALAVRSAARTGMVM
ncbi:MAG: LON peptidase substrate-binding domain-containing protein [Acidobacteriaceae bacterium]